MPPAGKPGGKAAPGGAGGSISQPVQAGHWICWPAIEASIWNAPWQ
jgi:hypothetical protein